MELCGSHILCIADILLLWGILCPLSLKHPVVSDGRIMQHPVNPCHFKLSPGTQTCKLDTDTYDTHTKHTKDWRTSWQSGGRKLKFSKWLRLGRGRRRCWSKRRVLCWRRCRRRHATTCRHTDEGAHMHTYICTYTNTYKLYAFKNMLLGTPYRLDAILSACTPLYIHRI